MRKIAFSVLAIVILAVGGWFGYQQYTVVQARKAEHARQVALAAQQAALAAKQHAFEVAAQAERKKQIAAAQVARQEIEGELKPLKVTSILPGNPGLAIIDKTEYAEGDSLKLTDGKRLLIAAIRADGVALACNGLTFHLDPPTEPDLAISRKGR
jgi:type II secretory pathway pseudopilin PulG